MAMLFASLWIMFSLAAPPTTAFISFATRRHGISINRVSDSFRSASIPMIDSLGASPVNDDGAILSSPLAPKTSTEESSPEPTITTFTSPTFRVYIEDTDAYGVMYNGNYIRSYERAMSHAPRKYKDAADSSSDDDNAPSQLGKEDDDRWILSFITNQKFRSSPALGEEYVIRGELAERTQRHEDVNEDVEVWHLEMVTQTKDIDENNWIIHNSAEATFTRSTEKAATVPAVPSSAIRSNDITKLGKLFEQSHVPYHDEFDMHLQLYPKSTGQGYHIPLRSAMNFFERSRTSYLGGPDVLRKMQVEDDILWVVIGIDDGELLLDSIAFELCIDDDDDHDGNISLEDTLDLHPSPGREVTVQTNFIAKRRGMIVDCQHRLFLDVGSNAGKMNRRLLAQATVTLMAVKGSTRRPTSKLPKWILDHFM
mmetsp:Transcript_6905/g.15762  ORF Transcript_6905/g.15762 Transcript_6905/m.15762 type:complete len:425 (-) Transcript_6905:83-1357(-)